LFQTPISALSYEFATHRHGSADYFFSRFPIEHNFAYRCHSIFSSPGRVASVIPGIRLEHFQCQSN
jgi:hypothetical protein